MPSRCASALSQLTDPEHGCLQDGSEVSAIGFKAVHGGRFSGVQRVTPDVLAAMEEMNQVAPAHNPPYIAAMRQLAEKLPEIPLVAAFETGFPRHGAGSAPLLRRALRLGGETAHQALGISRSEPPLHRHADRRAAAARMTCGSSPAISAVRAVCARFAAGRSVATSMGMSPQTGLPHNNRVGDFDPFALPLIMKAKGKSLDEVLDDLAEHSGLLGLSGVSGDVRDLEEAPRAETSGHVWRSTCSLPKCAVIWADCSWNSADSTFSCSPGGIGENGGRNTFRGLRDLEELGLVLDPATNQSAQGRNAHPRHRQAEPRSGSCRPMRN